VVTAQGRVRALGTRFSVATLDQRSAVSVQQHSVQVRNRAGQSIVVDSGQTLRFADDALSPLGNEQGRLDAWMEGRLEVDDASLGSVIDALRPYRYGVLRVSPAAAQLRVFGVFPLDDSDRALQSLAQVLPISVEAFGPITLIDLR
jgi:transmembrane sensor